MSTEDEIRDLKRRHSPSLLGREGVCGVGVEKEGEGFVLSVLLESDDPDLRAGLPERIEGHPVRYRVTGPFRKQGSD
ncbi:MAG TPA: hypothetical protein VH394_26960 [Thermoanaerobaculia bacterium]|jgi:hypothetical protein|nr:hypothetical protein [Thermoanaerobaculia bacterium]